MTDSNEEKRREAISAIYRELLSREADEPGLNMYTSSDLTLEQVRQDIMSSAEYLDVQRLKNFGATLESLGSKELLLMGSSPQNDEQVKALKDAGVQVILNLDLEEDILYDEGVFEKHLNIPINPAEPMQEEAVKDALSFMYQSIVVEQKKTFIHSRRGLSRSPIIIALFLMWDKQIEFIKALTLLAAKQTNINPRRDLVTGGLINSIKNMEVNKVDLQERKKKSSAALGDRVDRQPFVSLTENIIVGTSITQVVLNKLRAAGVSTLVDLNTERLDLPQGSQWFGHVHLPAPPDSLDSIMPVILRGVNKYSNRGKVFVACKDLGILLFFAENYIQNFLTGDDVAENLNKTSGIRKKLMSL